MSTIQAYNADSGGSNNVTATPIEDNKRALDVFNKSINLLETIVLKALSRLTFSSSGELRTTVASISAGTNNIGTVQANIGGFTATQSQQLFSNQNYQSSFRRNLTVT